MEQKCISRPIVWIFLSVFSLSAVCLCGCSTKRCAPKESPDAGVGICTGMEETLSLQRNALEEALSDLDVAVEGALRQEENPLDPAASENAALGEEPPSDSQQYPKVIATDLDRINWVIESEGIYLVHNQGSYAYWTGDRGSYTYWTQEGEQLTPFRYRDASSFCEGLACVCVNGKYGYLDTDGEAALPFIYDYATPFVEGKAYFSIGNQYGFMDIHGNPLFYLSYYPSCDSVSSFQEDRAYYSVDGRYGYLDAEGQVVIEPTYDDAGYFRQGFAVVRDGGRYGMIDRFGGTAISIAYDGLDYDAENQVVSARKDDTEYWFALDENGSWRKVLCVGEESSVVQPETVRGRLWFPYWKLLSGEERVWGLVDAKGQTCLPAEYESIQLLSQTDAIVVEKDGNVGLLGYDGSVILPYGTYDMISESQDGTVLYVCRDGKWGCMDSVTLERMISPQYDTVSFLGELARVGMGERYGVIDRQGETVYPLEYDKVEIFSDGSVELAKGGFCEIRNAQGETVYRTSTAKEIREWGDFYVVADASDDKIFLLDREGMRPNMDRYEILKKLSWGQENLRVAWTYGENDCIIQAGPAEPASLVETMPEAVLKNAITPERVTFCQIFLDILTEQKSDVNVAASQSFRYYRVSDLSDPSDHPSDPSDPSSVPSEQAEDAVILYYAKEPFYQTGLPLSESAFFVKYQEEAALIGHECGGSMRGNYVTLYYDRENGRLLPGDHQAVGGFAGTSYGGTVCRYQENQEPIYPLEKKISLEPEAVFCTVTQSSHNYVYQELLDQPQLFYDADTAGSPAFTKARLQELLDPHARDGVGIEDIPFAVTEYKLKTDAGWERVPRERYNEVKDRYLELTPCP